MIPPVSASDRPRSVAERVVSELRTEFDRRLLGVILAGSATKAAACVSDIDLFAIVATDWFQRRRISRTGIAVDLFIEPTARLDTQVRAGGNVAYVHALAHGIVLEERDSIAARYVELARSVYVAGPLSPTVADLFMVRLRARTLIDKVRSLIAENDEAARYMLADLAAWAPHAAYCVFGDWLPSPKAMLGELRSRWPFLHELMVPLLDPALSLRQRLCATETYYRALLGDDVMTTEEFIGPRASVGVHRRIVVGGGDVIITDTRPR